MRSGSKGVKNKNLKLINNKPLMYYTINQAIKSGLFENIVVSTNSKKAYLKLKTQILGRKLINQTIIKLIIM